MNETPVNGTQNDETRLSGTQVGDEDVDGDGVDEELLRQAHLSAMLTELVRRKGPTRVAEMLGVNYKTVARAQKSGRVTDHMRDALERLLEAADDPRAAGQHGRIGALEDGVKRLEGGMDALAKELRDGLEEMRTAVAGLSKAPGGDEARDRNGDGEPRPEGGQGAAPPVEGLKPRKPFVGRRPDPEVVTVEPADDDAEVFGEAWPLIEEWRRLRDGHPYRGTSLSWLTAQERLLVLELAMLEEHGLTLPPETQALRGFGRRGQTGWRWKALADTRVALRKRKLLRWVRRVLTLWLWRK